MGKKNKKAVEAPHRETSTRAADPVEPGKGSFRRESLILAVCFLYALFLSFIGITNHTFWDDEANTALFGRNLLATGELTAFDGVNVAGYREGAELDENLRNTYMPSLQYYMTAAAFALLGQGTFAGRILFVVSGLLALAAMALWVRWHLAGRIPAWLPVCIASIMPAWLLYMRQCRYYALGALFTFVLLAAWARAGSSRRADGWAILAGVAATVALWWTSYECRIGRSHASSFLCPAGIPAAREAPFPCRGVFRNDCLRGVRVFCQESLCRGGDRAGYPVGARALRLPCLVAPS